MGAQIIAISSVFMYTTQLEIFVFYCNNCNRPAIV